MQEEAMHRILAPADWLDSPVSESCTSGCLGFANPEASQQHNERQQSSVSSKLFQRYILKLVICV